MRFVHMSAVCLAMSAVPAFGQAPEAPDQQAGGARAVTAPEAGAEPTKAFTITGMASLVSDYRFRGISLSDKDIAIQGSIRVDHKSGFYVAVWASSIEQLNGAETEVDVYGGWAGDINGWKPDIGVYGYLYPGGTGVDYYEAYAALSRDVGPVTATVGFNYAPDQDNLVKDNSYVFGALNLGIPNSPLSFNARVGYEDGAFADGGKIDWQLGAAIKYEMLSLGVAYVDTDRDFRLADPGVLATLTASF